MPKLTPMLEQYLSVKEKHKDAILFFRMGDFYEMFFEDAEIASKALRITLTSRNKNDDKSIPMCGVPHHAADAYIASLIEQGHKVAVCDQVEDPRQAKGIVKREVTQVITPGTVIAPENLDAKTNNYLVSVFAIDKKFGLAAVDLSTGLFQAVGLENQRDLYDEITRIGPREILLPKNIEESLEREIFHHLTQSMYTTWLEPEAFSFSESYILLTSQFEVDSLHGYGCEDRREIVCAAGALLSYVKENQKGAVKHITDIAVYHLSDTMIVDEATKKNLEILESYARKGTKGSLLAALDDTETAMGGRMLRHWICYPLIDIKQIRQRLQAVEELKDDPLLLENLRNELRHINDLERLNGKVVLGQANGRDMVALKESLLRIPDITRILSETRSVKLNRIAQSIDHLTDVCELIAGALIDDPPASLKDGGFIRLGYNNQLDQYITASRDGKSWIAGMETREREKTGINSLKVGFNKIFGYYIEITKANLHLASRQLYPQTDPGQRGKIHQRRA